MTRGIQHALLRVAPLTLLLAAAPAAAELQFRVPAGWVDLAAGQPVPPGMRETEAMAAANGCQVYAIDPASRADGYLESMMAKVLPKAMAADEKAVGPFITGLAHGVHNEAPDAQLSVVEKGIVEVQGVPAIRVVTELTTPRRHLRTLEYVISGGPSTAFVAYTAEAGKFARYLPLFEANLQTVQGIAQPPVAVRLGSWLNRTPLGDLDPADRQELLGGVGSVMGGIVALSLGVWLKRRKKTATS